MLPINIGTPNNGGAVVTAGGVVFIAAATKALEGVGRKIGLLLFVVNEPHAIHRCVVVRKIFDAINDHFSDHPISVACRPITENLFPTTASAQTGRAGPVWAWMRRRRPCGS